MLIVLRAGLISRAGAVAKEQRVSLRKPRSCATLAYVETSAWLHAFRRRREKAIEA